MSEPSSAALPTPRLVLGIDTATDVRVGLAGDGVSISLAVRDPRAHAEQLLPLVQTALTQAGRRPADVSGIVVGVGPGPFTGLRVGVAAAVTLAEALGIEARGVCSLDIVARAWAESPQRPGGEFLVVSDARRKEVYWARYSAAGERLDGPFVTAPADLPELPLAGPGAALVGREVAGPTEIDGGLLAAVGDQLPDAGLVPLYLRRPDAEVSTTRKSTLLPPRLGKLGTR